MKRQNKKALYEQIMRNVAKTVKRVLNENENNEIVISDNDIKTIWETGELPGYDLDNIVDYEDILKIRNIDDDTIDKIINSYPGNFRMDVRKDINTLDYDDAYDISENEAESKAAKLNGKYDNRIYTINMFKNKDLVRNIVYSLNNSVIAKKFANVAYVIGTILSYRRRSGVYEQYINKLYNKYFAGKPEYKKLLNTENIKNARTDYYTTNNKSKELKDILDIEVSKNPIFPAMCILRHFYTNTDLLFPSIVK